MKIRRKIMTPANLNLDSLLSESDRSGLLVKIGRSQYSATSYFWICIHNTVFGRPAD